MTQMVSAERAAALRNKCLNLAKTCRSGWRINRASRAPELAAKAIEGIIDPSAPPEERAQRRRPLTKGPPEFREDRVDLPKSKH